MCWGRAVDTFEASVPRLEVPGPQRDTILPAHLFYQASADSKNQSKIMQENQSCHFSEGQATSHRMQVPHVQRCHVKAPGHVGLGSDRPRLLLLSQDSSRQPSGPQPCLPQGGRKSQERHRSPGGKHERTVTGKDVGPGAGNDSNQEAADNVLGRKLCFHTL